MIHSSLTAVHRFDNGYVEKQQVVSNEYCAEYWLNDLQKSMDRCTGRHDISEITKTALNTTQSINQNLLVPLSTNQDLALYFHQMLCSFHCHTCSFPQYHVTLGKGPRI